MQARLEQAVGLALNDEDRLRRDRQRFSEDNARLTTEVERLREENESLRASAEIWIRLYEHQLDRANRAIADLASLSCAWPAAWPANDGDAEEDRLDLLSVLPSDERAGA